MKKIKCDEWFDYFAPVEKLGVSVLPQCEGYTIDLRLEQFRNHTWGKGIVFIGFSSPQGRKLLQKMHKYVMKNR